jgi:dTDP-4-amino-4,6-dideoxygalactose transaminase
VSPVPFLDVAAANNELRTELDAAYRSVVDSGQLVLGRQVHAFEEEFAQFSGASHCVGVGNGYDALVLALRAVGVSPGDDVLVAAATHTSTWLAIAAVGARPIGVEIDEESGCLDPDHLEGARTQRTTCIVPVHLYGRAAPMGPIISWADRHGIGVVSDAAQAHGALYDGHGIGNLGDAVAWSFYPSKNLGALGDGGAVTTDDAQVASQVSALRHYGSAQRDVITAIGANSRLDELQAAFLRIKLRHLGDWNERRRAVAHRYLEELTDLPLGLPSASPSAWHLFVVRTPTRTDLGEHLSRRGIGTLVHYPTPPFAQQAFSYLAPDPSQFPLTRTWADQCLSLPIGPHLSQGQQDEVVAALWTFQDTNQRV